MAAKATVRWTAEFATLLLLADALERLLVRFLVNKFSSLGIAFYPPVVLGVMDLGALAHCTDAMPVAWRRILCHDRFLSESIRPPMLIDRFSGNLA
jgi:hypothetical protein